MLKTPLTNEYPAPYQPYIALVPEGDLIPHLIQQAKQLPKWLSGVAEEKWVYRYAPGKWSLKEVLGHMLDNEIVMNYRLLRISRGDKTSLPGYDQEKFILASSYQDYEPAELIEYYKTIRSATLAAMRGVTDEAWLRQGFIGANAISARALAYIIAGHELHHVNVIKEKYLLN